MKKIQFYSNTKDNNHCLQASIKMLLKFYFPKENYSFKKIDKFSNYRKNLWTWQGTALMYLAKKDLKIVNIENLDYKSFAKHGENYLKKIWNNETFEAQKKYSNLKKEQIVAKKLIKNRNITLINKVGEIEDIDKFIKKGFFLMVSVNPCVFEKKKGYWSHMVVITKLEKNHVTFHDPGLPAFKNRKVTKKLFEKAMKPPMKQDTNIIAFKFSTE